MKVRSVGVRRVWDCMLCSCVSEEGGDGVGVDLVFVVYYESIKRELKTKTVYGCRCDERIKN